MPQISSSDTEMRDKNFYVGAWITRDCFAYGKRDGSGNFSLKVPVDFSSAVDTLKIQTYVVMKDPETELTKPFPLGESVACLKGLCAGTKQDVVFSDTSFGNATGKMTLQASRPLTIRRPLKPSAMYRVDSHNKKLDALLGAVNGVVKTPEWQVPKAVDPFMSDLTYLPNGGSAALGIPPVKTHFAGYGKFVDGVSRALPHALLGYYLQAVLTQQGLTIQTANGLPDRAFARLAGSVLGGLTNDADGCPYQFDRMLSMGIGFDSKFNLTFGLQLVSSEDIGMPFAQSTFIERDFTPLPRPDISAALREPDACQRLQVLIKTLHGQDWRPLCRALLQDDCETSATAAMLTKNTVHKQDMSTDAFRKGMTGYTAFANWKAEDFQAASAFYTRLQGILRSGKLTLSTVVGLAGGAAASSEAMVYQEGVGATTDKKRKKKRGGTQPLIDQMKDLGGHCFGVLRFMDTEAETPEESLYVGLVEGTTCMLAYHDRPDGPEYTVRIGLSGKGEIFQKLSMSQFLSLLCNHVSLHTQVINRIVGMPTQVNTGIQGPRTVVGFVRPTAIMKCLHCLDRGTPTGCDMPFYKWCMFTGMTGEQADMGIVPIDELEYSASKRLGAGCRPAALADPQLRGLTIALDALDMREGSEIMDEVWPPIADDATFKGALNLWETLPSLTGVHRDLERSKRAGVSYTSVACMESPSSPEVVDIMYEMNRLLAEEANRINLARSDSDGIFMTVHRLGTGVTKTLHVPEMSQSLTFVQSLKEAMKGLGWPCATPLAREAQQVC